MSVGGEVDRLYCGVAVDGVSARFFGDDVVRRSNGGGMLDGLDDGGGGVVGEGGLRMRLLLSTKLVRCVMVCGVFLFFWDAGGMMASPLVFLMCPFRGADHDRVFGFPLAVNATSWLATAAVVIASRIFRG